MNANTDLSVENRIVDPEAEIFWSRIRESYNQAVTHGQSVAFEMLERRVDVEVSAGITIIAITSVPASPTTLILPPGSTLKDTD